MNATFKEYDIVSKSSREGKDVSRGLIQHLAHMFVQNPNFLGCLNEDACHSRGKL